MPSWLDVRIDNYKSIFNQTWWKNVCSIDTLKLVLETATIIERDEQIATVYCSLRWQNVWHTTRKVTLLKHKKMYFTTLGSIMAQWLVSPAAAVRGKRCRVRITDWKKHFFHTPPWLSRFPHIHQLLTIMGFKKTSSSYSVIIGDANTVISPVHIESWDVKQRWKFWALFCAGSKEKQGNMCHFWLLFCPMAWVIVASRLTHANWWWVC